MKLFDFIFRSKAHSDHHSTDIDPVEQMKYELFLNNSHHIFLRK